MIMTPGPCFASLRPAVSLFSAPALPAKVPAAAPELSDAISKGCPVLVRIHVVIEEGSEDRMKKMQGSGSGAIISGDGLVLANHHVAGRWTYFV
jgi:S1-C subfamily serine protease